MAVRRPRIKPVANIQLNGKRKQKPTVDVKELKENTCPSNENEINNNKNTNTQQNEMDNTQTNTTEIIVEYKKHENKVIPTLEYNIKNEREQAFDNSTHNNNSVQSIEEVTQKTNSPIMESNFSLDIAQDHSDEITTDEINEVVIKNDYTVQEVDETAFKYPPKVDNNRPMVNGADDVFYSDLEDNNPLQMDLHKFNNCYPMSPTKSQARQRVRVTPIFGQRRNSFIMTSQHGQHEDNANNNNNTGNNNVNMEYNNLVNQRRERHLSGSIGSINNLQTRQVNMTTITARTRTESGCSTMSESTLLSHSHKSRKSDDSYHHRQNGKRDFENRFPNGMWDKSMLKMFDLIYYNPISNPIEEKSHNNASIKHEINNVSATNAQMDVKVNVAQEDVKIGVTESKSPILAIKESSSQAAMPVPQLKLNANGELILDDKSLVIETTAEQEARKTLANSEPIFLDEHTGMNGFYKRQKRTREWFADETIKFYRCLQTIGTDFSLMVSLFPNRTRRDLKLKFKKEERINGALINKALLYPKQFNIDELKRQIDAEEADQKNRKCQLLRKYKVSKKTKKKYFVSAAQRLLEQGDENIYEDENVKKIIRRPRTKKLQKKLLIMKDNKESTSILNLHKYMEVEGQEVDTNEVLLKTDDKSIKRELDGNQKENFQIKKENQDNDDVHSFNQEATMCTSESTTVKDKRLKRITGKRKAHFHQSLSTNSSPLLRKEEDNEIEMELNHLLQTGLNDIADITTNDNTAEVARAFSKDATNLLASLDEDHKMPAENKNEEEEKLQRVTVPEFEIASDSITINAQRLITNLDDGTTTIDEGNDAIDSLDKNNTSVPPKEMDVEEEDEEAIQKIIRELSEGSLVLVSTFDPDNENNVINEIFRVSKHTDELEDEPLNLPDYIIQGISTLLNKS